MDQKALDQALALFEGFRNNLPVSISENCVREYHSIVDAIGTAAGETQLHVFKIGDHELEYKVTGGQRRSFSGRPGHVTRSQDKRCDSNRFQRQIDALSHYLESQAYSRSNRPAPPTRAGAGPTHSIHIERMYGSAIQQGTTGSQINIKSGQEHVNGADADCEFARLAIDEARKSVPESDGRPHPKVGAVVVKDGRVVSSAHRGERPANHAEYIALEKKQADGTLTGATVYTTLEPCTTRNHPKIPCAERLIERKVARVVIGMLDPDERIRGRGIQRLRDANIVVELFPPELVPEIEEMNREFSRLCNQQRRVPQQPQPAGPSWPDVLLQCQWRSQLTEPPQPPGSHIVRNRIWELCAPAGGPVYNVQIGEIDFGGVFVSFAPVDVLTGGSVFRTGEVFDRRTSQRIAGHDLESLITHPPSECDINKYTKPDDPLSVEIPVAVAYGDAHGDRYVVNYVLKYEVYSEEGRIVRNGGISKL